MDRYVAPDPPKPGYVSYISSQFLPSSLLYPRLAKQVIGLILTVQICESNMT